MGKKIAISVVVVLVFLVVMALKEPDVYVMTHSVDIESAPETVFDQVNNFHNWNSWFYSEDITPEEFHRTYEGPESGIGAITKWEGSNVGAGQLRIIESTKPDKVIVQMERYKPFKGKHHFIFSFERSDDHTTRVTWVIRHNNTFIAKLIHAFISLEAMFGKDNEVSLSKLKALCEKG